MMQVHMKNDAFAGNFLAVLDGLYRAAQDAYKNALIGHVNRRRAELKKPAVAWPTVGDSPSEVIWRDGDLRLLRYRTSRPRRVATPILAVCSLINRPYVLDLLPERSVVQRLLEGGRDVWLLDWGTPRASDAERSLADYTLELLGQAAAKVVSVAASAELDVLGYCMGGTMALLAAAAGAIPMRSLVAMATPVRFSDGGLLSTWARVPGFSPTEIVGVYGNAPPHLLQPAFKMLDPVGLATKLIHVDEKLGDDAFVRFFLAMETWLEDSVAFPGGAFIEWIKLYRDDPLVGGDARLGRNRISLSSLRCPILNLVADGDYITPPASALALGEACPKAPVELRKVPGGHIGLATSSYAQKTLWPEVAAWLTRLDSAPVKKPPRRTTAKRKRTTK
jgi:polyhydroxyalkanoate synthase